jgi:hypothetical protein
MYRTTQKYIKQHKKICRTTQKFVKVGAVPRLCGFYPGICFRTEEKNALEGSYCGICDQSIKPFFFYYITICSINLNTFFSVLEINVLLIRGILQRTFAVSARHLYTV